MRSVNFIILGLLFISFLSLVVVEARKKNPQDKRPTHIEPELYCNSCQAIIREILKKIGESRRESDVADALSDICSQRNYVEYEFPPPDMVKGCHAFISGWDELIEKKMVNRASNADIENDICLKRTRACLGVDPSDKSKKVQENPGFVKINDKEVPISADGQININGADL
ncbi:hypothetical protein ABPG74_003705 [Tetrahymena malaccensis]